MENKTKLPLRIGVGVILLNNKNNIFVGKRIDNPKDFWQMPQGGVDNNENLFEAAKRELEEETSIKSIELIKEFDFWLEYNLPKDLLRKISQGRYGGQKQKWFIMQFTGTEDEINIKTNNPEFLEWKWIKPSKLTDIVVDFKYDVYNKIKQELRSLNLI